MSAKSLKAPLPGSIGHAPGARFKSEIAKIPLRANLGNVKVPGGTTPQAFLVQSLSRGQRTSCQIMMDLADFVLDNKSRAIDRTELGALDRL
jgi:hypothetical protein